MEHNGIFNEQFNEPTHTRLVDVPLVPILVICDSTSHYQRGHLVSQSHGFPPAALSTEALIAILKISTLSYELQQRQCFLQCLASEALFQTRVKAGLVDSDDSDYRSSFRSILHGRIDSTKIAAQVKTIRYQSRLLARGEVVLPGDRVETNGIDYLQQCVSELTMRLSEHGTSVGKDLMESCSMEGEEPYVRKLYFGLRSFISYEIRPLMEKSISRSISSEAKLLVALLESLYQLQDDFSQAELATKKDMLVAIIQKLDVIATHIWEGRSALSRLGSSNPWVQFINGNGYLLQQADLKEALEKQAATIPPAAREQLIAGQSPRHHMQSIDYAATYCELDSGEMDAELRAILLRPDATLALTSTPTL